MSIHTHERCSEERERGRQVLRFFFSLSLSLSLSLSFAVYADNVDSYRQCTQWRQLALSGEKLRAQKRKAPKRSRFFLSSFFLSLCLASPSALPCALLYVPSDVYVTRSLKAARPRLTL